MEYKGKVYKTFEAFEEAKKEERSAGIIHRTPGLKETAIGKIAELSGNSRAIDYSEYIHCGGIERPEELKKIFS